MREPPSATSFSTFLCKPKEKQKQKKNKKKQKKTKQKKRKKKRKKREKKKQKEYKNMKRQIENPKGQSRQKLRQSKFLMLVELHDDLILPSGGTQAATLARSHFKRKISQFNLLGLLSGSRQKDRLLVQEEDIRVPQDPQKVVLCLQHAWHSMSYSKILWPMPVEDVAQGKDLFRTGCILWNLRY